MNDCPDACIIVDEDNRVIGINSAVASLLALSEAAIVGKILTEVLSGLDIYLDPDETLQDPSLGNYAPPTDGQPGLAEMKVSSLRDADGNFFGRVAILRTLRSSQGHEVLQNQNEILIALQETTFELHSSLDLKVVLHNIVERACKLLETSHAYLVILRESGRMEPVVGFGALEAILDTRIAQGKGVAGIVWKTGLPLFVPDYDHWPGRLSQFQPGVIRAILGMPLILNGRLVGVIGVARGIESDTSFSEEDITVLKRFAALAVLALQNARLFEQAQSEIQFRRKTEMELRNANQVLQLQIERIELLQEQLQEQAVRDSLTNLFNRRYLEETLEVEFARATRSETSLAILMMDCDRLKHINDTYGHKAGDDSLVLVANVIRESIRAGDIACRYGGDEFVVVLSNVSQGIAIARAENLRNRLVAEPILHGTEKINISISVGIAMFPAHGTFGETLLHKADQALYDAKHKGRNKVQMFSEEKN